MPPSRPPPRFFATTTSRSQPADAEGQVGLAVFRQRAAGPDRAIGPGQTAHARADLDAELVRDAGQSRVAVTRKGAHVAIADAAGRELTVADLPTDVAGGDVADQALTGASGVLGSRQRRAGDERNVAIPEATARVPVARCIRTIVIRAAELVAASIGPVTARVVDAHEPLRALVSLGSRAGGKHFARLLNTAHLTRRERIARGRAPRIDRTFLEATATALAERIAYGRIGRSAVRPRVEAHRGRLLDQPVDVHVDGPPIAGVEGTVNAAIEIPPAGGRRDRHVAPEPFRARISDGRVQIAAEAAVLDVGLVATERDAADQNRKRERPADSQRPTQGRPRRGS